MIWNDRHSGQEAGHCNGDKKRPRWEVMLDGVRLMRSRVVYALHKGFWPLYETDHEDRNTLNDKIWNLRHATHRQNSRNRGKTSRNKSGYKGVYWDKKHRMWCAEVGVNYRNIKLGLFDSREDAYSAYCAAAKHYHGRFFCPG
jgi:hypothetical protein